MAFAEDRAASARVEAAVYEAACSTMPVAQAGVAAINKAFPAASIELKDGLLHRNGFTEADRAKLDDCLREVATAMVQEAVAARTNVMAYRGRAGQQPVVPRLLDMVLEISLTPVEAAATSGAARAAASTAAEQPASGDADAAAAPAAGAGAAATSASGAARLLEPTTFMALVEHVMEVATIEDCQQVFEYMESKTEVLKVPDMFAKVKLGVLRVCNFLLKRLSKATNVLLCGRILAFLAKCYSLSERSGVNVSGTFNTSLATPIDEVAPGAVDSSGEPIDPELYRTFWSLQAAFQNPASVLQPAVWAQARSALGAVLDAFKSHCITVACGPASSADLAAAQGDEGAGQYLSSSKLFGLQLRDATFRRHYLVQGLILTSFLRTPGRLPDANTAAVKQLAAAHKAPEDLDELEGELYAALEATPEDGKGFAALVRQVLQREGWWVAWKKEACPAFEKPPVAALPPPGAAPTTAAARGGAKRPGGAPLAAGGEDDRAAAKRPRRPGAPAKPTFEALIQIPADNYAGLANADRGDLALPSVREYVNQVLVDIDPENAIEEEYRAKHQPVYAFKAMRLLARHNIEAVAAHRKNLDAAVAASFPSEVHPDVLKQLCPPDEKKAAGGSAARAGAAAAAAAPLAATAAGTAEAAGGGRPSAAAAGGAEANGNGHAPVVIKPGTQDEGVAESEALEGVVAAAVKEEEAGEAGEAGEGEGGQQQGGDEGGGGLEAEAMEAD